MDRKELKQAKAGNRDKLDASEILIDEQTFNASD
jgi:hypothetical protein